MHQSNLSACNESDRRVALNVVGTNNTIVDPPTSAGHVRDASGATLFGEAADGRLVSLGLLIQVAILATSGGKATGDDTRSPDVSASAVHQRPGDVTSPSNAEVVAVYRAASKERELRSEASPWHWCDTEFGGFKGAHTRLSDGDDAPPQL